jgi:WD40 repeat protein
MDSSQLGSGHLCIVRGQGVSMLLCDALSGQVLSSFNFYKATSKVYEVEYDRWATKAILFCKLGSVGFGPDLKPIVGFLGWDIRSDNQLFSVRSETIEAPRLDHYGRPQQGRHTTISINHAGNKFVSTTQTLNVCVWDALSGTPLGEIIVADVGRAWLSFDDSYVVADSASGELRVWDSESCTLVSSLDLHSSTSPHSLSPQNLKHQKSAVVGLGNASHSIAIIANNRLCVFDFQTGLCTSDLCEATTDSTQANYVDTVVFSPNDELVATTSVLVPATPLNQGAGLNEVRVWNTQAGDIVHVIPRPGPHTRLEFNSNDNTLLFDGGCFITQASLLSGVSIAERTTFTDVITHICCRPAQVILL